MAGAPFLSMAFDPEERSAVPPSSWLTQSDPGRPRLIGIGLLCVTYLAWLGRFPLTEPDEARYAEIPREMLQLGDWITPHLNFVKYFEKPPFVYWLNAALMAAVGKSESVARLSAAAFGLIGIVVATSLARRMFGRLEARLTFVVLATSPLYFGLSQVLLLDMPLAGLMTCCLAALWLATSDAPPSGVMLAAAATAAAAVLTKGPVAVVLIGAIVISFAFWERDATLLRRLLSPAPLVLFVGLALPWFVMVQRRNPEFFDFFVIKQHLQRYLTPDEHQQPLWFFAPFVVAGFIPWSIVVLAAPASAWRLVRRVASGRISPATRYCLAWFTVIFVFFSLSGSKLATYIVPAFPPLAILIARFLSRLIRRHEARPVARTGAVFAVLGLVIVFGGWIAGEVVELPEMATLKPCIIGAGAVLLLGGTICVGLRASTERSLIALAMMMAVLLNVVILGRGAAQDYASIGKALRHTAAAEDLIVVYGHYAQTIPYYARRRVTMVRGWGELTFGSQQGDQSEFFWPDDAQLLRAWSSPRHLFLVINRNELEPLLPQFDPPPRYVTGWGKKVLLANFPTKIG